MLGSLPYKTKQFLVVLIKLSIVVSAFYFIIQKLLNNSELEFYVFVELLSTNGLFSIKIILLLLFLSILNWLFETLKWKTLVSSCLHIPFKNALEQSLGALTASLITPNRIGEYGAKAIYFPKNYQNRIMLLNLIGNMAQMTSTIVFGLVGLYILAEEHILGLTQNNIILTSCFLMALFAILFYVLTKLKLEIKGFSIQKVLKYIRSCPLSVLMNTLLFSMFRYLIFSLQFYFLLLIFSVEINYFEAMTIISSMYLLSSIIPSIFMFDVVIKGSIAVYLFSMIGVNEFTILTIVTLMWIYNLVVPSVVGSYFVLTFSIPKIQKTV